VSDSTNSKAESPVDDAVAKDAATSAKGKIGWLSLTVAAFFGLFYAYDVWAAFAPIVALPSFYDNIGLKQSDVPWWLLVIGLLIPVLVFAAAFFIGLRRSVFAKALIFILGLAVVAALSLGVNSLELVVRTNLLAALPPGI
jgi:hypothetical protein